MVFLSNSAYFLGYLAFGAGLALYFFGKHYQSPTGGRSNFAKFWGVIIMILTVLNLACAYYHGFKYWKAGYFENTMEKVMMDKMMMDKMMMEKMMMLSQPVPDCTNCPCMLPKQNKKPHTKESGSAPATESAPAPTQKTGQDQLSQ